MQDDRPRRGNGRHGGEDENGPGTDSGFFTTHGFDNEFDATEFDATAFENTALNDLDPIREAQLFEQFEQDYRSGGYDPGPDLDRYGPDPRDRSGHRPATDHATGSGYHSTDSGYRDAPERHGKPRHGKSRDKHQPSEGGARIPLFNRKTKPPTRTPRPPARRPGQASANQSPANQSPLGELTAYVVPILAAVVIVMVLVVLVLNR